ncbi:AAA family ATPase [Bacillus cytotoxicus]
MIQNIKIKGIATYDEEGAQIEALKKINYIYGSNGSGKTTISEVIRGVERYPNCEIAWNSNEIKTVVYNRNFVEENFRLHSDIKGIFTLGKESTELSELIDQCLSDIGKNNDNIFKIQENLKGNLSQQRQLLQQFKESCWNLKIKYDLEFKEAFDGFRNSKDRFTGKFLSEIGKQGELKSFEEIIKRKESVFNGPQEKIKEYSYILFDESIEKNSIFQAKIIGKEDVDIAALISTLNISDWVKQGHIHMRETNGSCPFCQQELPGKFIEQINEYFDETYTTHLKELDLAANQYQQDIVLLLERVEALKEGEGPYLNLERISYILDALKTKYKDNQLLIEQKKKEPSRIIMIESLLRYVQEINTEIEKANQEIKKFNVLIDNIQEEKTKLIRDMWYYVSEENRANYTFYEKKNTELKRVIEGMEKNIRKKKMYNEELKKKILGYQEQITNIQYSIGEINRVLKSFGFNNFKLAEAEEQGSYKIIRENGEDAKATLSEGEKTFITFLYFYQLIKGSESKEQITFNKVVVIDDPISSLDSNVLFIVSSLIRQLISEVRTNGSSVKQLFILTHNVYFHKEVSFNKGKGNKKLSDETFWIVRKTNNRSYIQQYDENPIKTSYELLWKELKVIGPENSTTIQNIMRRIIENYFKFFGSINVEEEIEKFVEEERYACRSLFSWINDGSHHISEDLFVEDSQEVTEKYFEVFKNVFINLGHKSHYEMMMKDYEIESKVLA